jgi:hypothetical protein
MNSESGGLSFSVQQADGTGRPSMTWELTNLTGADGRKWSVGGNTTNNDPGSIDDLSSASSLTVTVENGVVVFNRFAIKGSRKDLTVGCRVDFTMTMLAQ